MKPAFLLLPALLLIQLETRANDCSTTPGMKPSVDLLTDPTTFPTPKTEFSGPSVVDFYEHANNNDGIEHVKDVFCVVAYNSGKYLYFQEFIEHATHGAVRSRWIGGEWHRVNQDISDAPYIKQLTRNGTQDAPADFTRTVQTGAGSGAFTIKATATPLPKMHGFQFCGYHLVSEAGGPQDGVITCVMSP